MIPTPIAAAPSWLLQVWLVCTVSAPIAFRFSRTDAYRAAQQCGKSRPGERWLVRPAIAHLVFEE